MINKIYNKIIPILILVQPLFDVITSIMTRFNYSITIGVIIKIALIFLCVIYLIFFDKRGRKVNLFLLFALFIFFVFNILANVDIIKIALFQYFNYMVKYIYLIIMLQYFIRWFSNGNRIKLYQLRIPIFIITVVFFLALITKTSFYSYDEYRRGFSGWFNSANELGALLCLFFPISIFNAFHSDEHKVIDFILFIGCGLMLILVGTKTGLLGFALILLSYIIYRFITVKRNKLDFKILIIIFVLLIPLIFWRELPAVYNTNLKIKTNNITNISNENVSQIILSGRDEFSSEMETKRENIKVLPVLFGKSYLRDNKLILIVERDVLDIYYMYGIVGIGIFILLFMSVFFKIFKSYFSKGNVINNICNIESSMCILSIFLTFAISYISGHVLLSPSVSTYLVLVIAILYDNYRDKDIKDKKDMIIYMSKLSVGGMEQALINLLEMSNFKNKCNIDLYLGYSTEKKYLDIVQGKVNVNLICKREWRGINKVISTLKMGFTYIDLIISPYKYDVSICYPYQHGILAHFARLSSKNNIIFIHNDLLKCRTNKELERLKKKVKFDKFSKVVCVSECAKNSFMKIYPNYKGKVITINNYINGQNILKLSKEKISDVKNSKKITFVSVGRHEEKAKRITRIIESSNRLFNEGYDFRVILVGDGENHKLYEELVEKYKINDKVLLLGKKVNPYPYFKISDCLILSSEYEGYGLILDEARVLDIPIISTNVADSKKIMEEGYGILCENSINGVYNGMKEYLNNGYKLKKKFEYNEFNKNITRELDDFILGD